MITEGPPRDYLTRGKASPAPSAAPLMPAKKPREFFALAPGSRAVSYLDVDALKSFERRPVDFISDSLYKISRAVR